MSEFWYIHYHMDGGNLVFRGTLEGAMRAADENAACSRRPISIHGEDGSPAAVRDWNPGRARGDEEDTLVFRGRSGFYEPWRDGEKNETDWDVMERIETVLRAVREAAEQAGDWPELEQVEEDWIW